MSLSFQGSLKKPLVSSHVVFSWQSWNVDSTLWILDSWYWIPDSLTAYCGFQSLVGFRIPWVEYRIQKPPQAKIPLILASLSKNFPYCGICRITFNTCWYKGRLVNRRYKPGNAKVVQRTEHLATLFPPLLHDYLIYLLYFILFRNVRLRNPQWINFRLWRQQQHQQKSTKNRLQ